MSSGRYADIVSGMLGEEIISGGDDLDLISGLDDETISGNDLELIAGALEAQAMQKQANRFKGAKSAVLQRILAEKMAQGSTLVREKPATKGRTVPLGFDSESDVLPGQTRRVTARPQVIFKGQRLVVGNDVAGAFLIQDLIVGKNSQFAASGAIPARAFESQANGVELDLDTAQIGQDVTIYVTNTSSSPVRFVATLIGKSVE